jgi:hypothetical protein
MSVSSVSALAAQFNSFLIGGVLLSEAQPSHRAPARSRWLENIDFYQLLSRPRPHNYANYSLDELPLCKTNTCTCIIFAQAEKRTDQEVAVRTAFYWEREVLVHAISDGVLPVWLAIVVSAKNQRLDRWRQTEDCHSTVALGACLSHFGLPNTCQLENGQIPHVSVSRTSWRCFWTL